MTTIFFIKAAISNVSYSLLDTSQLWILQDNELKNKETDSTPLQCSRCSWTTIPKNDCPTWMHIKIEGEYKEQKAKELERLLG